MRAKVDKDACVGCGLCEGICPEVFKMNDDDIAEVIVEPIPADAQASCREAADSCPADAIYLED